MLIGHKKNLDFLKNSIQQESLSHAYLFTGSSKLGKRTVAFEFIKNIFKKTDNFDNHPDLFIVEPEVQEKDGVKKELDIGIDQTKKTCRQMSLYPYSAPYKIALIDQANKLTQEASNSLLKLLEEPSPHTLLILITSKPKSLLPTIVSRCQSVKFLPVAEQEMKIGLEQFVKEKNISISEAEILKIIKLSFGRPGLAINYIEDSSLLKFYQDSISKLEFLINSGLNERYGYAEELSKNTIQARSLLNYWLFWYRDVLFFKLGIDEFTINPKAKDYKNQYSKIKLKNIIQNLIRTDSLLNNSSINARLALEVLMLEI